MSKRMMMFILALFFSQGLFAAETLFSVSTVNPYVFKNNKIVTFDYDQNGKIEFFQFDLESKSKTIIPLYDNNEPYYLLSGFNGKDVVYVNFNATNNFYIDHYNNETNQSKRIISNPSYKEFIWSSQDKIVWIDYRNLGTTSSNSEVYLYDLLTSVETRITNDTYYQAKSVTDGRYIVWVEYSTNQYGNLVLYDIETKSKFFIDPVQFHQDNPKIFGNYIVWEDYRNTAVNENNVDIFLYDITNKQVLEISTEDGFQGNPFIYQNMVVWEHYKNNNNDSDIQAFNLNTNESIPIASELFFEANPQIDLNIFTWVKIEGNITTFLYEKTSLTSVLEQNEVKGDYPPILEVFPNPFNPTLNLKLNSADKIMDLSIFNISGKKINIFDLSSLNPGQNYLVWEPGNIPSGNYYIRLVTESMVIRNKVTYIK